MRKFLKRFLLLPLFIVAQDGFGSDVKLTPKEQSVVLISAYTANGDMKSLELALDGGLESGLSINEIKEILVQLYAYTGFPRSLNALNAFQEVLSKREKSGKKDEIGKEASALPKDFDRDKFGAKTRARLWNLKEDMKDTPWQKFSPTIDKFLKEHLFADIFARDNLSHKLRELATISALGAMSGLESQLGAHMVAAKNVGYSNSELKDFIAVLKKVDKKQAGEADKILQKVLAN